MSEEVTPATIIHPEYSVFSFDWCIWRHIYEGGRCFADTYLKKFSNRESTEDFEARKCITPVPAFAKAGIIEIKNSIFQRLSDVKRIGGSESFQASFKGEQGGVDGSGSSMNWFIGERILPELLTMKKVGLYIDAPPVGPTLADKKPPYFYIYRAEDIRSWDYVDPKKPEEFKALLLQDRIMDIDPETKLPIGIRYRFRFLYLNDEGTVSVKYFDTEGQSDGQEIKLKIKKIPFVVFELSDSLLKDVSGHQIALLNLESSDIGYILKSNFPFYTEQKDSRGDNMLRAAQSEFVRSLNPENCETDPSKNPDILTDIIEVGPSNGRYYGKGMDRPDFIAPPTEPLQASMAKQENLKDDIRKLIHLSLSSLQPKMASAESKQMDMSGLESGLSYIGLELERGENQAAAYWAMYENTGEKPATCKYPEKWSLRSDDDKRKEIDQLSKLKVPSQTFRKEISKKIAILLLENKVSSDTLNSIISEIDQSKTQVADPDQLRNDFEAGLIPGNLTSLALGYPEGSYDSAKVDQAERLARIKDAQTSSARGVDAPPSTAVQDKKGKPVRGVGQ